MGQSESSGSRKMKVVLTVSVILIGILVASNFWFFLRVDRLEDDNVLLQFQVNTIEAERSNFQSTIDYLETCLDGNQTLLVNLQDDHDTLNGIYKTLNSDYNSLESDYNSLESERNSIKIELDGVQSNYDQTVSDYLDLSMIHDKLLTYIDRPLDSKIVPSHSELSNWLASDNTDLLTYHSDFDCKDFSTVLSVKSRLRHWDMGIIAIHGTDNSTNENYAHAVNFIVISEGLVYVEPQTDEIWWYGDHVPIREGVLHEIGIDQWIMIETVTIVVNGT